MKEPKRIRERAEPFDQIDIKKLGFVLRNNLLWFILIFVVVNLTSYLTVRWLKNSYVSESEMKLERNQDAIGIDINTVAESSFIEKLAGEIEQIKSKVFLSRIIDSLHLEVSYYSIGNVLNNEMYHNAPVHITLNYVPDEMMDKPIYIDFDETDWYTLRTEKKESIIRGTFGKTTVLQGLQLVMTKTDYYDLVRENNFFFIVNSRRKLFNYFDDHLTVEPLNTDANTFRIAFQDHNLIKTQAIVNQITSSYIEYRTKQKNLATKQKIEWLDKELLEIENIMENFESYFEDYVVQNKSGDTQNDIRKTVAFINKIDSQYVELKTHLQDLETLLDQLASDPSYWLAGVRPFLPAYINDNMVKLYDLTQQKEKAELSYTKNTRTLTQKEKELDLTKNLIMKQLYALKKHWTEYSIEIERKKIRLEKDFISMPGKNTRFSKNQRLYRLYEQLYLMLMKSKTEYKIIEAGNTPDFQILSPATLPMEPVAPIKRIILGIGLVAGFFINFILIGILYLLYDKIVSEQDVEQAVSAPILGLIPASYGASTTELVVRENSRSAMREAIWTLYNNLGFFTVQGSHKIISVTSTVSGEGKSFLALNLSSVLAHANKKVMLINTDMRKIPYPTLFENTQSNRGLSTIISKKDSWKECLIETQIKNMSYIPSGPSLLNPQELLLNERFEQLLSELKMEYEFIIMDTPPIGLVTDGLIAMKKSDISIYLFRVNYSKKKFINIFSKLLEVNKLKNTAIVLNGLKMDKTLYHNPYYQDNNTKS